MFDDNSWRVKYTSTTNSNKQQSYEDLLNQVDEFGNVISSKSNAKISLERRIRDLKDQKEAVDAQIESLTKAQEFYDALDFKEGSVAVHREYGNVLVKDIEIDHSNLENSRYIIISTECRRRVPYKELMTLNEVTKTLYGRAK